MSDPLLSDAIDGFDAVPGEPGQHTEALARLAEGVARSASGGRAAARSRAARLRERRVRGWSVAAAAVFLAAVAGGGVWMLRNDVPTDQTPTLASRTNSNTYRGEVVEILPPVTVITEEEAVPETPTIEPTPLPPPTEMGIELPVVADITDVMAEAMIVPEAVIAHKAAPETPARDTTQTVDFRRHVADRNRERSAVMGPVAVSFEVSADGRPTGVQIVESPTPELGEFVRTLLDEGPDWPVEPSQKLITINL